MEPELNQSGCGLARQVSASLWFETLCESVGQSEVVAFSILELSEPPPVVGTPMSNLLTVHVQISYATKPTLAFQSPCTMMMSFWGNSHYILEQRSGNFPLDVKWGYVISPTLFNLFLENFSLYWW